MVRMKDIAGDLGIYVMTVSRALRNDPEINPVTRAGVLRRAMELNYLPNLAARAL
jgi:LacI family transcriptional regulator